MRGLKSNGEAIYGTHVWRKYGEGPTQVVEGQFSDGIKKEFTSDDIRYTMKGDSHVRDRDALRGGRKLYLPFPRKAGCLP